MNRENNSGSGRRESQKLLWQTFLLLGIGALLIAGGIWVLRPDREADLPQSVSSQPASASRPEISAPSVPEEPLLEAGHLYLSDRREKYQNGEMTLTIPRLGVESVQVQDGTGDEELSRGPGLFEYAQMPSENGGNVSIAGHRDIDGAIFYYVHNLSAGDYFYLDWQGKTYRYIYEKTYVVAPDNWDPIQAQGYSCLTLVSCDPIGTSLNRIIVVARQDQAVETTEEYDYKPWQDGMEKPYAWEPDAVPYDRQPEPDPVKEQKEVTSA